MAWVGLKLYKNIDLNRTLLKQIWHTKASWSNLAYSSFKVWINSWAVHWEDNWVKPSISPNKMLEQKKYELRLKILCTISIYSMVHLWYDCIQLYHFTNSTWHYCVSGCKSYETDFLCGSQIWYQPSFPWLHDAAKLTVIDAPKYIVRVISNSNR